MDRLKWRSMTKIVACIDLGLAAICLIGNIILTGILALSSMGAAAIVDVIQTIEKSEQEMEYTRGNINAFDFHPTEAGKMASVHKGISSMFWVAQVIVMISDILQIGAAWKLETSASLASTTARSLKKTAIWLEVAFITVLISAVCTAATGHYVPIAIVVIFRGTFAIIVLCYRKELKEMNVTDEAVIISEAVNAHQNRGKGANSGPNENKDFSPI